MKNPFTTSMLSRYYIWLLLQPKDLEWFIERFGYYMKKQDALTAFKRSIGYANAQTLFDPHKKGWGSGFADSMQTGACITAQDVFHDEDNPRLIVI
jgi:hypothetical protein